MSKEKQEIIRVETRKDGSLSTNVKQCAIMVCQKNQK